GTWILGLGGLALLGIAAIQSPPRRSRGPLGPLASLISSWEWIQFDREVRHGAWQEAYVYARRALELDPHSVEGWSQLASHLVFLRGSLENEPRGDQRVAWMQRGLAILEEGERRSDRPAELALIRGQILAFWITSQAQDADAALPWPGGAEAAWQAGVEALQRAHAAGLHAAEGPLAWALEAGQTLNWLPSSQPR
ncbi:MAG TPA: hypothetical protein P5218_15930, partial [Planctomycetota bacterium]|nr:hypothetical protein [Planctomycetota bacterium]